LPSEIGAFEAEEVGVEHLLRDIRVSSVYFYFPLSKATDRSSMLQDNTTGTLSEKVMQKLNSLKGLKKRLDELTQYLNNVIEGKLPISNEINDNLQDIFNLLPYLGSESLIKSLAICSNDSQLVTYISSLIRFVVVIVSFLPAM